MLIFAAVFCLAGEAIDAHAEETGGTSPGSGSSYWGSIPSPSDTNVAAMKTRPRSAWEYPVLIPYQVVNLPLRYTLVGIRRGVIWLDDVGFIPFVKRVLGAQELPYGILANFSVSPLNGFGAGATLYHDDVFSPRNRAKLRSHFSAEGARRVSLGLLLNEGDGTEYEVGGGYRLRPNARYFGLGPQASETLQSRYTQEIAWGGVSLTRMMPHDIQLTAGAVVSGIGTRGPGELDSTDPDHRPVPEVFSDDLPAGYGDRSDGVMYSIGFAHDDTRQAGRPESGGVSTIKAAYFSGLDTDDGAFYSYRADLQQFLPLWFQERALALRGVVHWIENDGDVDVPFQRLLTNDEPDIMGGFRDFRWRDRGITTLMAEYRFPLWAYNRNNGLGTDLYLFSGVGQVFREFEEISERNMRASYGGGLRFQSMRGFVGRFEIGVSEEETVVRLAAEQIFQYAKGGLFNGRDKSVLR